MSTPNKKDALGKGIRSLLQNIDADLSTTANTLKKETPEKLSRLIYAFRLILLKQIPDQPRHDFDESSLSELAASVKMHDIIQPLTVTKLANGKYRIIAGERRFRAAKIAGLADVLYI